MLSFFNKKTTANDRAPKRAYHLPLHPATREEYTDFIVARLKAGGKLGSFYGYPFEQGQVDPVTREEKTHALIKTSLAERQNHTIFYAMRDCEVPALYGANAIKIIAARGVEVTTSGHNDVLAMDDPLSAYLNDCALYSNMLTRHQDDVLKISGLVEITKQDIGMPELDWRDMMSSAKLYIPQKPSAIAKNSHRQRMGHTH